MEEHRGQPVSVANVFRRILEDTGRPYTSEPALESVLFPDATATVASPPPPQVNTQRGSTTASMVEGLIPTSPSAFEAAVTTSVPMPTCTTPRRRRTRPMNPPQAPRRSTRLAKKASRRTPAAVAAQNVLMKKLNITKDAPPEANDIGAYITAFRNGLTEEQVRLIEDLFVE